jgi:LacI family transcriptional regulator
MATIKDIAKISGVSYPTVSHVLNRTRDVSAKTRKKVFDAIEEVGYIPNGVARGLRRSRMNAIGLLVSIRTTSFFEDNCHGPISEAAIIAAQHHDQSVTLYFQRSIPENPENISLYCDGRCDGLIIVGQSTGCDFVTALRRRKFPFICVTEAELNSDVSYVDADQVEMAQSLADHLLDLGHRKILVICGEPAHVNVPQRIEGCSRAFQGRGLTLAEAVFLAGDYRYQSGYERVRTFLDNTPRTDWPTAIYCFNDFLAQAALQAIGEKGLRCPEDISVVGIDDDRSAATTIPPLTTMRLPLQKIGQKAVDMLLEMINSTESTLHQVNLPAELILRNSTAPPRTEW